MGVLVFVFQAEDGIRDIGGTGVQTGPLQISGSNRHVLDFLAEEVLERQPRDVSGFLLTTSVLESISAPLCDALTGRDDGQQMLERLERENLFAVPLDDERVWHRYHHLFGDFLRSRRSEEHTSELQSCQYLVC